jgi:hypothetical protein
MSDTEEVDVDSIEELLKKQPVLKALFGKALGIFADPKAGLKSQPEKEAELRAEILKSVDASIKDISDDN